MDEAPGAAAAARPVEPIVRYTVMSLPPNPTPGTSWHRLRAQCRPNGTYDFPLSDVIASLERAAARKRWHEPPERGSAVIRTWHNRHPRAREKWVKAQAQSADVVEVSAESAPVWLDVAEDLIARGSFLKMTCPRCARDYVAADLAMRPYQMDVPEYKAEGRLWSCPAGHELLKIADWVLHHTERARSFYRREE
jgi:hypothetical protein